MGSNSSRRPPQRPPSRPRRSSVMSVRPMPSRARLAASRHSGYSSRRGRSDRSGYSGRSGRPGRSGRSKHSKGPWMPNRQLSRDLHDRNRKSRDMDERSRHSRSPRHRTTDSFNSDIENHIRRMAGRSSRVNSITNLEMDDILDLVWNQKHGQFEDFAGQLDQRKVNGEDIGEAYIRKSREDHSNDNRSARA